jgi:hypothetical protein
MTIIAERWPIELCPSRCTFGRSRNDKLQLSPRTERETIIVQGRAKWQCKLTWDHHQHVNLPELRRFLDGLDGHRGSVILWDFEFPYSLIEAAKTATPVIAPDTRLYWSNGGSTFSWSNGTGTNIFTYALTPTLIPAGSTLVPLMSMPPSATLLKRGEYIQFGRRLYLLKSDLVADSEGFGSAEISTALITDADESTEVRVTRAGCEFRLARQSWESEREAGNPFGKFSAEFVETEYDVAA